LGDTLQNNQKIHDFRFGGYPPTPTTETPKQKISQALNS